MILPNLFDPYYERHEAPPYTQPVTNDLSSVEARMFVGPISIYLIGGDGPSAGAVAYRRPLSAADLDDIAEQTDDDVRGPYGERHIV